jgi:hypothetical protein
MPVDVDRRAIAEGRRASRWFARRSPSTASRFQAEFDRAIADIGANPSSYPP